MIRLASFAPLALALSCFAAPAQAEDLRFGGKLLLTNGISTVEGAAGGGLTPWAVIAGGATRDGVGAQAAVTEIVLQDYDFRGLNVAVGAFDRVELSYARQRFDTNRIGGALGLGNDFKFDQDVWGAKLKLFGDIVYGSALLPAVAIGVQYRKNHDGAVVRAVGGQHDEGVDYYVSATKLLLAHSVLLNATLRYTKANQYGLLGYGGDKDDGHSLMVEGSAAYQLSRRFAIGAEYRSKPNKLSVAREDDVFDIFAAHTIGRHLTATVAYTDLGSIATANEQRGVLVQLQAGF